MAVNKVVYRDETLIDLTEDTVTEDTLLEGSTAHNAAGEKIEGRAKAGSDLETIANLLWPVGSIYFSVEDTNPKDLFGVGKWERWGSGQVPVGLDSGDSDFNTVEKTGGVKSYSGTPSGTISGTAITSAQMPAHTHGVSITSGTTSGLTGAISPMYWYESPAPSGVFTKASEKMDRGTPDSGTKWGRMTINYNGNSHTHSVSGNTGSSGSGSTHTHTFNGDPTMNTTLQPYITCYMWKRIA